MQGEAKLMVLVEALRELLKEEAHKIGIELDLSDDMIHRHPFPGLSL
ncbi:MAG: hypothetical protein AB2604_02615 [Candidatus Thiodiazotropha taylori]